MSTVAGDVVATPIAAEPRLWRWFRDLPIRRKLTYLMLVPSAAGLLFAAASLIGNAAMNARANALRDLQAMSLVVANNAAAAVAFRDGAAAEEILSALRFKPENEGACLYVAELGEQPSVLASYASGSKAACPSRPGEPGTRQDGMYLLSVTEVLQKDSRLGWLLIRQNLRPLQHALSVQIAITLAVLAASFAATLLIGLGTYRVLARPLLGLAHIARRVSQTHEFRLRAQKYGNDELGRLVDDFNEMLGHIAQRDGDLRAANHSLEQTLGTLRETQSQLVQSERLASLGSLVAGVAHEINTPVGVGVTAASTLRDHARELAESYARGDLKRSSLEQFITTADEAAEITLKNLQRAADLIASFKQVAVDQSSGERRQFALREYIDEVPLSLAPRLKKYGHALEVDCPAALAVDTYPGAIAQILTNLVSNALVHAFDAGKKGHLRIHAEAANGWVTLTFADDGRGIPQENLGRIFDPFFTTRRGAGGSGLGLHIVFNLVHQLLGGTIDVVSAPGRGSLFTIRFPIAAPRAKP